MSKICGKVWMTMFRALVLVISLKSLNEWRDLENAKEKQAGKIDKKERHLTRSKQLSIWKDKAVKKCCFPRNRIVRIRQDFNCCMVLRCKSKSQILFLNPCVVSQRLPDPSRAHFIPCTIMPLDPYSDVIKALLSLSCLYLFLHVLLFGFFPCFVLYRFNVFRFLSHKTRDAYFA